MSHRIGTVQVLAPAARLPPLANASEAKTASSRPYTGMWRIGMRWRQPRGVTP